MVEQEPFKLVVPGSSPGGRTNLRGFSSHLATPSKPVTKSEIDRIGDKLRKTQPPDEGLLEQLQQSRAVYDGTMARVHGFVASLLGLAPTSRIKTVNTIVEKLIRSKTRLSSMQDIAGVRVVLGEQADIGTQDVVVAQLVAAFGKAKVDDLRGAPRHGYRAVERGHDN